MPNVKELQDSIENAPIFGGVKIVLPELVEEKDKLAVHTLLAKQQAFLSKIGELFGNFNRILKIVFFIYIFGTAVYFDANFFFILTGISEPNIRLFIIFITLQHPQLLMVSLKIFQLVYSLFLNYLL